MFSFLTLPKVTDKVQNRRRRKGCSLSPESQFSGTLFPSISSTTLSFPHLASILVLGFLLLLLLLVNGWCFFELGVMRKHEKKIM